LGFITISKVSFRKQCNHHGKLYLQRIQEYFVSFSKEVFLLFMLVLVACSKNIFVSANDSPYQLFILKEDWQTLNLGYEAEPAQSILASVETSNNLFTIGVGQIEEYDWDAQSITLTKSATNNLLNILKEQGDLSDSDIEELKALQEPPELGNPLEMALYIKSFVVKANGEFKYGGIILNKISAMGISYPVIRVTMSENRATFTILPTHPSFMPIDSDNKIQDENIKQALESASILKIK
jgi:hypothetical protein